MISGLYLQKLNVIRSESRHLKGLPPGKAAVVTASGIKYVDRADYEPPLEEPKKKRWHEMSRAQQAGVACADETFQRWLHDSWPNTWTQEAAENAKPQDIAAAMVRSICNVGSRALLNEAEHHRAWDLLYQQFTDETRLPYRVGQ